MELAILSAVVYLKFFRWSYYIFWRVYALDGQPMSLSSLYTGCSVVIFWCILLTKSACLLTKPTEIQWTNWTEICTSVSVLMLMMPCWMFFVRPSLFWCLHSATTCVYLNFSVYPSKSSDPYNWAFFLIFAGEEIFCRLSKTDFVLVAFFSLFWASGTAVQAVSRNHCCFRLVSIVHILSLVLMWN